MSWSLHGIVLVLIFWFLLQRRENRQPCACRQCVGRVVTQPGGRVVIGIAVSVCILKIVRNTISISIDGISGGVGGDVMVGNVGPTIRLFDLETANQIRGYGIVIEPDGVRGSVRIPIDNRCAGELVPPAQRASLIGRRRTQQEVGG